MSGGSDLSFLPLLILALLDLPVLVVCRWGGDLDGGLRRSHWLRRVFQRARVVRINVLSVHCLGCVSRALLRRGRVGLAVAMVKLPLVAIRAASRWPGEPRHRRLSARSLFHWARMPTALRPRHP